LYRFLDIMVLKLSAFATFFMSCDSESRLEELEFSTRPFFEETSDKL
jgi:hypothetical protein